MNSANGDMIPDLVGETYSGSRVFFVFRYYIDDCVL